MTSDLIDLGPTQRLRVVSSTPGSSFDVPPRTAHAMWNAGAEPCRATWRVTPAQRTLELFRTMGSGPSAVGKAAALWRFRREFRLGSPRGGA